MRKRACRRSRRRSGRGKQPVADDDLLADAAEQELGHEVVLDLGEAAHGTHQLQPSHVLENSATPGEVSPGERPVLVLVWDDVLEGFLVPEPDTKRREVLLHESALVDDAQHGAHLADGVGDEAVTLRTPATDEPHELLGIVPVREDVTPLDAGLGHGEAEAAVLVVPHESMGYQRLNSVGVIPQELAHVDLGVVLAGVDPLERHGADIQQPISHTDSLCARVVYWNFHDDDENYYAFLHCLCQ